MFSEFYITGILISLGLSFFMLYTRKRIWISLKAKYFLNISLLGIGLLGLFFSKTNQYRFVFYSLLVPPISFAVDRLFKSISGKLHNRDFYLYLSGSEDLNESNPMQIKNDHIMHSDIVFSFTLLIIIFGLTILGAGLFGKDDLFTKWFVR